MRTGTLSSADTDLAYAAAQAVVRTHERLAEYVRAGRTLAEIDARVGSVLRELGVRSCFLGYKPSGMPPFPNHACLSVNDCVVHGMSTTLARPLERGDVFKLDIGVWHKGFVGDAAWTYSIGEPEPRARALMDAGKESLRRGVEQLRPGNTYAHWARAVQSYVEGERGYRLVRGLGGHGIGRSLHGPPYVSNVLPSYPGEWPDAQTPCAPGTLVAVEPMLAETTGEVRHARRSWPIFTADGSLSVHYEHDVLITEDGPRVLSEGMERLPDVLG